MDRPGLSRRFVLLGSGLLVASAAGGYASYSYLLPTDKRLSVTDAHRAATSGQVVLIDIRRPDEWQRTGIGEGADPIDMRRQDFIEALDNLVGGDRSTAVALICARGVRSAWLSAALTEAGYDRVLDVPEGMLGSFAGPGWLKTGLPVKAYSG